jgi:ATP-dependent Clp protease ATP-binding subunit ClpC
MFEKFTDRARRIVVAASDGARRLGHGYIGTEHILLGVLSVGGGGAEALQACAPGLSTEACQTYLGSQVSAGSVPSELPFTPRAKTVLRKSNEASERLGHSYISTEHVLLGLLEEDGGMAQVILHHYKVDFTALQLQALGALERRQVSLP